MTVTLSSNNTSVATVPASVTVAAGASTATFTVTTIAPATAASATLSATYSGVTKTAVLQVQPLAPTSVQLSPATVAGTAPSTGTVTLNGPAPSTPATVVTLSSNNTAVATVPASVTVPVGATTATFTVTTFNPAAATDVTISAARSGTTQSATLTVVPSILTSVALSPTTVVAGADSTGTITLSAAPPTGGAVIALSSNNASAVSMPATVTILPPSQSATFTLKSYPRTTGTSVTVTATYRSVARTAILTIQAADLSAVALSPTSVNGGAPSTGTVTLTGPAPPGGLVINLSSNNTAVATVPASVTVPEQSTTAGFTVTTFAVASDTSVVITATKGATNRTATLTVRNVLSLSLSPTSVVGGQSNSTGTVTLGAPAPVGGAVVTLASDNTSAATVPSSVTVLAGATQATFTVTSIAVPSTQSAGISATYNGVTRTSTLQVSYPALSTLALNPATVTGGLPSTGTVTLTGPAPTGGATVTLASANPAAAAVPASLTVPAGASTATFTVTTSPVASSSSIVITASRLDVTKTATLTVQPPSLLSLVLSPTSVTGGTSATGTVTLSDPAPAGGAVVALSSANPAVVAVPASIMVAPGATTATFKVTTYTVGSSTAVTLTATYNGTPRTAVLTVTP